MNNYTLVPLTKEQIRPYSSQKIIVVRLFESSHLWYAGVLSDYNIEDDNLSIALKSSVRFEHRANKSIWLPEESLVKASVDKVVQGTRDKALNFSLKEAQIIIHPSFGDETGILGIEHSEGFAHLSYRGSDVLAIINMLENI